ncbi:MAG: hypothetical protein C0594_07810, partial [Marinilabiliales bacterium]
MKKLAFLLFLMGVINSCNILKPESLMNESSENLADISDQSQEPIEDTLVETSKEKEVQFPYQETRKIDINIHNVYLEMKILADTNKIHCKAKITFSPHHQSKSSMTLDAINLFDLQTFKYNNDSTTPINYSYDGRKLYITFDTTYSKEDTLELLFEYNIYAVNVSSLPEFSDSVGIFYYDRPDTKTVLMDEVFTQGQTTGTSSWLPIIDDPQQRVSQEFYITTDYGFTAVSNGELLYKTQNKDSSWTFCWVQHEKHPVYVSSIAVGNFNCTTESYQP